MDVRRRIERYLRSSGMPPTRFGRECARDPRLVSDIRKGRALGRQIVSRIDDFLAERGA